MLRMNCAAIALLALAASSTMANDTDAIRAQWARPNDGFLIVAHRGCHNPAPSRSLPSAPENSLAALDHCVTLGVDVMETDVRRSKDGYLVMVHDDTVDRTTTGSGKVAELTLEELRTLRLRENLGGPAASATDQRVVTLEEMLARAKGRILLNLDVKAPIYAEVVHTVGRAGAQREVIVKAEAGLGSPALAAIPPYDQVPMMPILSNAGDDLGVIVEHQFVGAKPVAFELPRMTAEQLPAVAAAAKQHGVRLFANTLGEGFVAGFGGDMDALRSPDQVWGRLLRAGVTIFQTDEPDALVVFRSQRPVNQRAKF